MALKAPLTNKEFVLTRKKKVVGDRDLHLPILGDLEAEREVLESSKHDAVLLGVDEAVAEQIFKQTQELV